jgi:gliding motility-associated-like protein
LKKHLLILLFFLTGASAFSSHLMGGNIGYEYLGPSGGGYQYKIRLILYYNCDQFSAVPDPEPTQTINIYKQDIPNNPMGGGNKILQTALMLTLVDSHRVEPPVVSGCGIGMDVCINKGVYEGTVILPLNFNGYHLYFENYARNAGIINLDNPGATGMSFEAFIPPTLVNNSTPVFFDDPVPFLCQNDTTSILNTAFDPDGDQLIFSFVNPFSGSGAGNPLIWPITPVTYAPGYSVAQPFGAGGYSFINGANGLTEYLSPITGNFVVCVEIREFRNGNLIGVSRRDLQLLVIACPPNNEPELTSNNGNIQFSVQECSSLCFPITFSDPDADSILLQINSPLNDPSQFNPVAIFDTLLTGPSPQTSNFCWTPGCGTAQALPYLVIASATDNGCPPKTDNIVYEITVTPPTAPSSINGPNPVCANTTATYTTDYIPGYTYNWTISNGIIISGQDTNVVTVEFPSAGSASLTVNSINTCGCPSETISLNITVLSAPVADAGPDVTVCLGDSITIGGVPTGPSGSTFSWSPSSTLTSSSSGNPEAFPSANSTYIVTVDNGSACVNYDTVQVNVQSPIINAGSDLSICLNDTVQLSASGAVTYSWSPSAGLSNASIYNPLASPSITTSYFVTGTDLLGCKNVDTLILTVNPLPVLSITGDTVICLNESTMLTATGATNYTWSPSAGLDVTNTATPVATPLITTIYTVIGESNTGCLDTTHISITVNPLPVISADGDTSMCAGQCQQISATGGVSYSWLPFAGLNDASVSNPISCPAISTVYTVTGTDLNGCTNTDSVDIVIYSLPVADAGSNVAVCISDTIQLNASGGVSYLWTPSAGLNNTVIANPLAFPLVSTTYYVHVTDVNGCENDDSVFVTVNTQPITVLSPDTTICQLDTFQLHASGGVSYSWSPSIGLSAVNISDPMVFPAVTTTYSVIISDINGCSDTNQVVVTVNPLPNVITGNDTTLCVGACSQIHSSGAITYSWSPAIGLNNSAIGNPVACPLLTTVYEVTGTDNNGCSNTDSVTITVNSLPLVDAGNDTSLCLNDTIQLSATGAVNYLWQPVQGLSNTGISNPLCFPVTTTSYTVTGTDVNGCVNSDTIIVTVNPLPIANAGIDMSICIYDTAQLNGSGAILYSWSPTLSLSDSLVSDPFAFPVTTTNYVLEVTDNNGCKDKDTMTLTVNPLPNVITGNDTTLCVGACSQIHSSGAITYSWSPAIGLNNSAIGNPVACPLLTTVYEVTGTDNNGCSNTDSVTITVNSLPLVDAGNDTSLCLNDTIQLSATGAVNYLWQPVQGLSNTGISNPLCFPVTTTSYTVTGTDVNGCVNSDTIIVTVNPLPIANAGIDMSICIYDTAQLNGSGAILYSWSPTLSLSDSLVSDPFAFPVATTNYVLEVTDNNGCKDKDTMTLTVNPLPNVITGNDTTVCLNSCIPINTTGAITYTWNPSLGLNDPFIANPIACPLVTTEYFVEGIDINGCHQTDSVTITVLSLPVADAGVDLWLCPGGDIMLSGSGGGAYTWSPVTGLSDPAISNPDANPLDTTEYILTVTDINGCEDSDSMIVFVNGGVPVNAGADKTICDGDSVQLGSNPTSPSGTVYLWSPSISLNDPTSANPISFPIVTTMYIVNVTNDTCTNSDTIMVIVNPIPLANAGPDLQMCLNDSVQLSGTGGIQYLWSPSLSINNDTISDPFAFPSLTTEYFVSVTDINGCVGYDSAIVTVFNLPVVNAGNDTSICTGDTAYLNGNGGFVTYQWSPGTTLNDSTVVNPLAYPLYTTDYQLSVTDTNSCRNTDTVKVTVNSLPVVDAGSDTSLCIGETIGLSSSGGVIYQWSPGSSLSDSLIDSPDASPLTSIMYYVNVIDANGCKNNDSVFVNVNMLPFIDAGTDTSICIGNSVQLTATSGLEQYIWNPGTSLNDSMIYNPVASPVLTTEYFLSVTDSNGCNNSDSVSVTVHSLPIINAGSNISICRYDTVQLNASGGVSYLWSPAVSIDNVNATSPLVWPDSTMQYLVSGTDIFGCVNEDSILVNVFRISGSPDTAICEGSSVQLYANGANAVSWSWTPTTDLNNASIYNPVSTPVSTINYHVTVTDNAGCIDTLSIMISVESPPVAGFTYTVVPSCEGLIATFNNQSSGAQNYVWLFGDGTTSTDFEPEHTFMYNDQMTATLITTNNFGCSDTITGGQPVLDFTDYYQITIPNVFTPNGDGVNDLYEIHTNGMFEDCLEFKVFNRWGKLIYESNNANILWDGKVEGNDASDGLYYYIFSIYGIEFKGTITILE